MRPRDRRDTTRRCAAAAAVTVFAFVLPGATDAAPAPSPAATGWAGVSEVVVANVDASGAVSGVPSQTTMVTALTSSTIRVGVPMSSAGLKRIGPGSPPPVVDDSAQFSFDGSGTQTQTVSSEFVQSLPVTVTPSYQLDGRPVTPDDLTRSLSKPKKQSGVLTVSYEIANVTRQTTTVSFVDAAGKKRTETLTQAVPIAGALSLTFPKDASGIDAPGADLTPGALGVGASWTVLLAPPLAPARQSISYSMNVKRAAIPRAKLAIAVVVPAQPLTGEAPAAIGAAVATAQAAGRSQLAQAETQAHASLEQVQADLARLEQAQSSGRVRDEGASDARADVLARLSDGGLSDLAETISNTASNVGAEINAAAAQIRDALNGVRSAIADHIDRLKPHAAKLILLKIATQSLMAKASTLAAQTIHHLADATDLSTLIAGAIASLDLFGDHNTPEWTQLAADLAAAQAKASVVVSAAAGIRTATANINAAAQQLSTDVATLTDGAADLVAAGGAIRDHVSMVIAGARAELAAAVDAAGSHVTELAAQADAARSNLAGQDRDHTARVDSARRQTSADVAAKGQAAQATLHGALTDAQNKARQASDAYVQLLALAQLGLANQLPAGNATGATVQAGSYVYRISGTR